MLFDFLIGLLEELRDAGPLAKTTSIIALAAIVTVPAGLVVAWYRRGVTHLKDKNAELTREARELRRARETLVKEVEGLGRQTIPGLAERAALERRDGNEERAIALVRSFADNDAAALGTLCREIASWHLSMVEDDPPGEHWHAAKRFATLAVHLEPSDHTAISLLAEINARTGEAALRTGDIEATRRAWEEAWHWAPVLENDATLVDVLLERLPKAREEGDFFRMLALAQRAVAVCRRTFGIKHPATCVALYHHSMALTLCGRHAEALEAIDALLPIRTEVSGERHPEALLTRWLHADVLRDLGRDAEALGAIDVLLPVQTEVNGERHPDTLAMRWLRAAALRDLGRHAEAMRAIDALLPIATEVSGERHPHTLTTRWLRAAVLRDLGRHDESLEAIDALLPVETEVCGERHPKTLATRGLRASVLQDLGRHDEAMSAIDAVLPIETEVLGERHTETLVTLRLRGSVLRSLGQVAEAVGVHRAAHAGLAEALGERHPRSLYAAADLGLSLAASGDAAAAEALLASTLVAQSSVLGSEHPDTRRTDEALAALRAQGDGMSAAAGEKMSTSPRPITEDMMGPGEDHLPQTSFFPYPDSAGETAGVSHGVKSFFIPSRHRVR